MPSPRETLGGTDGRRTLQGRWKMVGVMLLCAAPVIASYFTYYVIRPEARSVYGELINPQRPAPDMLAQAAWPADGLAIRVVMRGHACVALMAI